MPAAKGCIALPDLLTRRVGIKFTPFAIGHGSRFADFLGQIRWKCPPALTLARQPFCRRCEPAYPVRTRSVHQIAKNASTGAASRHPTGMPGANCKPCKPCFVLRRWRNAALSPPALEYRQEGPLSPGHIPLSATITIRVIVTIITTITDATLM